MYKEKLKKFIVEFSDQCKGCKWAGLGSECEHPDKKTKIMPDDYCANERKKK